MPASSWDGRLLVSLCRDERGQIPNFVAINFITIGNVLAVVDELNGVA